MKHDVVKTDAGDEIKLVRFVDTLSGGLITNGLGVLSDKVENFRLIQALSLRDKLEAEFKVRGITSPKAIRPKILIPLLEEATLEDDDEFQSRYANLLANASDPNYKGNIQRSFVTILAGLEPIDVAVLDLLYDEGRFPLSSLPRVIDFNKRDIELAMENLGRNSLLYYHGNDELGLAKLGRAFVEAMQSADKKSRTDALAELQDLGQEYEAI